MTQIFVSYSRADHDKCVELVRRLRKLYGHDNVWFDDEVHGGADWWRMILGRVEWCDIFVFLVSRESLESTYCKKELSVAMRRGKKILPILIRARANVPPDLARFQWIDAKDGYTADTMTDVTASINALAHEIERSAPVVTPFDQDDQEPPRITEEVKLAQSGVRWQIIGVALSVILGLLAIIVPVLMNGNNPPSPTASATLEQVAQGDTQTPSEPSRLTVTPSRSLSPSEIFTPSITPTATDALDIALIVGTLDANATIAQATQNSLETAVVLTTAYASLTKGAIDATATATLWTATPTANVTASIEAFRTMQAATNTQAWIDSWTDTPAPTYTSTPIPLGDPGNPVTSNDQWDVVTQDFDGVTMVLVPAGCFDMGNDPDAYDGSADGGHQCFDAPFWIDQTEVTNGQYGSSGNWRGENRPRESVRWFQARDFCASRDARLPTEAEWEYAARGPDGLTYPWGNEWTENLAVWNRAISEGTANVGSIPAGASWVGALDMSGNVWEWVSSLYQSYPIVEGDGREADTGNSTDVRRMLRGGSWLYSSSVDLRAASRYRGVPDVMNGYFGFRCARSS